MSQLVKELYAGSMLFFVDIKLNKCTFDPVDVDLGGISIILNYEIIVVFIICLIATFIIERVLPSNAV